MVFWTSINQFTCRFKKARPDLTPRQSAYLTNSLQDAFAPIFANQSGHYSGRTKRQALGVRVRREIRSLDRNQLRRYFAAVNAMKRNPLLPPNVYDFLAAYHTGDNIRLAHFGPAFPSWHRLYLWIFEYFLRLEDPSLAIPYWGSVMDNDMEDATLSPIFSEYLFGNGDGTIRTGPFRDWAQINESTSFTRNVQPEELYTYDGIDRILAQRFNRDILIPTARPDSNFEMQHGRAHVMVGGSMASLQEATYDPIFFSHHCFVDQIWARFRINQRRFGINPETDNPFNENDRRFRAGHNPTANAGFAGLGGARTWTQNLGYLNVFERLVRYADLPSCPRCDNSPFLFCNRTTNRCVPRTMAEIRSANLLGSLNSQQGRRKKRAPVNVFPFSTISLPADTSLDICPRKPFINDVDTRRLDMSQSIPSIPSSGYIYILVKVVSKRPIEYKKFDKYSLYNQGIRTPTGLKDELLKPGIQKVYEHCDRVQDAVGKIKIVSYGLNYDGFAEEHVIIDNRLGVSEATGFVPVRMPTYSSPSEAVIAAFDSCGRVCKPYCKKGSTGAMVTDSNFSGGIRVSTNTPLQYANSYADALLNMWDVPSKSSCPTINYDNIPISFFCEYTDTWIWDSTGQGSHMGPGQGMFNRPGQGSHMGPGQSSLPGIGQGTHMRSGMEIDRMRPPRGRGRFIGGRRIFGGRSSDRVGPRRPPHSFGIPHTGSFESNGRYAGRTSEVKRRSGILI